MDLMIEGKLKGRMGMRKDWDAKGNLWRKNERWNKSKQNT